jgi:hypothetical protein
VKLDPEERIIAARLDQAELDDATKRGAGAYGQDPKADRAT